MENEGDESMDVSVIEPNELHDLSNGNEIKLYESIRSQRMRKLGKKPFLTCSRLDANLRMSYLMKQSEIFTQFLTGASSSDGVRPVYCESSIPESRGKRSKMSENEEDSAMVTSIQSDEMIPFTWIEAQPRSLVGGALRPCELIS
jgi:hypothetical protein